MQRPPTIFTFERMSENLVDIDVLVPLLFVPHEQLHMYLSHSYIPRNSQEQDLYLDKKLR